MHVKVHSLFGAWIKSDVNYLQELIYKARTEPERITYENPNKANQMLCLLGIILQCRDMNTNKGRIEAFEIWT